jgi:hypothetical protein
MNRNIPLGAFPIAVAVFMLVPFASAQPDTRTAPARGAENAGGRTHKELGTVHWLRDFDAAVAESKRTGKPVLILFDEVPGCATCVGYGATVMTHPLIVEAAEELFVPVAVFNNIEGADRKALQSFGEPAWNNPVVRIVSADRKDLVPRVDGDYTARGILSAMTGALRTAGKPVPGYLAIIEQESRAGVSDGTPVEKAVFSMYCFWEGEAKLGGVEGVLATRTVYTGGQEGVEVTFDPKVVTRAALEAKAKEMSCSVPRGAWSVRASPADDKHQLRGTAYAALPMTPLQASRVNAAVGQGRGDEAKKFLSPRQAALLERLSRVEAAARPSLIGRSDMAAAWREAEKAAKPQ